MRYSRRIEVIELDETEPQTNPFARTLEADDDSRTRPRSS